MKEVTPRYTYRPLQSEYLGLVTCSHMYWVSFVTKNAKIDVRQNQSQKGQYFQRVFHTVTQFTVDPIGQDSAGRAPTTTQTAVSRGGDSASVITRESVS